MSKTYTSEELKDILVKHKLWLDSYGSKGKRADLSFANLRSADLSFADLSLANLSSANLRYANLRYANLSSANLRYANLSSADLSSADLRYAKNLDSADLAYWIVPEEGEFIAWKKVYYDTEDKHRIDAVLKLAVQKNSKRCCNYSSRKVRVSKVKVLEARSVSGEKLKETKFYSGHDESFTYTVGKIKTVKEFCDDPNKECAEGIHIFITRKEAEKW